ncbi:alpha/beta hydrolase [candidate division KSB1 bacterium]|nr:alpha/beta hydrolase [candidate division KSB1 bacterium]
MLPGLDGTGALFSPFIAVLSKQLTPIVVSYPKDWPLDYDDLEHYLVERINAKEPFVILAESFSGPLALRLAAKSPPNLVAVILCATFVENPLPKMSTLFSPALAEKMFKLALPKFLIRHLLMGKNASNDMIDTFCENLKTVNPKVLATRIQSVFAVNDRQSLANCPQPIFYLYATKDRIVSRRSLEQIRKIRPDVEIALIDAPHLLLQCMPKQAAEAIQSFLKRRNLCL